MATAGRSLSSMSEETFDFICTSCDQENKTLEAVRYCVECLGYCCQFCTDLHKKFPALRNHNLVDVGQGYQAGNQKPTLPEFPTERCGEHHDKVLDMYCEKHDVVGCYICLSKDHRSCPESQFYSISDMVDKLFNLSISKQTKQHLKEMMVSVASICDSKDVQLAKLIVAKNESLRKVTEFQKALEAAIKRAADMSKKELEDMYKQLEEEILQDKTEVKKIEDVLRNTSDNIKKAEGNRAQGFVLTKLAEAQMNEADDHMSKLKTLTDVQLSFTPSQSLMDYINGKQGLGEVLCPSKKTTDQTVIDYGAQGIGEVVGPSKKTTVQTVIDYGAQGIGEVVGPSKKTTDRTVIDYGAQGIGEVVRPTKKRTDLYKVKGSKDINIKLSGDSFDCQSLDCCLTLDNNQLLLTDKNNKKLKRFDVKTMTVIDHCNLDGTPRGVSCVGTDEAIVACEFPRMIQFVSIDKKVIPTRQIKMSHDCYGIATKDNKLYITDYESSVYIYDMLGNLLKTISQDNAGNKLFSSSRHIAFNDSGNMYVSCRSGIVCLDNAENYVSTYNDDDLINTDGLCGDGRRNIFVVGCISQNVVQFNEEGKKMGVVIKQQDGLQFPHSLCFHQRLNRLFVSMNSDVLKMYELE